MDLKFLDGKTLSDLEVKGSKNVSNLLELSDVEKIEIITLLKNGNSFGEVKKLFKRVDGSSQLSASLAQIQEINNARLEKILELTPKD